MKHDYAKAYKNRGDAYNHKGDYDLAITDYNTAIQFNPNAKTYISRGVTYAIKGSYDHAIKDFDTAIKLEHNSAEAYYYRGGIWLYLQEWDKARMDLSAAKGMGVDVVSSFHSTYESVADFERKQNVQLPEDIVVLLTSEELEPDNADMYNTRGLIYSESGDYNQAIAAFAKAIELNPESATAHHNRGNAYRAKGEIGKAIADYSQAIVLKPKVAESYYIRGEAWLRIGKWEEAQRDLTAAILQGMNIAAVFHNTYGSIVAFEKEIGIKLPEGIVKLLTPRQEPLEIDKETRVALAMKYYENEELSSGLAARLAGVSREEFWYLMGDYGLSPFGTVEDLRTELENARKSSHQ